MRKLIANRLFRLSNSFLLLFSFLIICNSVFSFSGEDKTFLNENNWKKSVKNVNYTEDFKDPQQNNNRIVRKANNTSFSFTTFSYIALFVIIGLLIFLLLKVFQDGGLKINKRIKSAKIAFETELNEDISNIDLDYFLAQALQDKNYKLALRINFLMILKSLEINNLIKWKIDKTNGDYLSELAENNKWMDFASITLTYEKVWYGDIEISNNDYSHLSQVFESFKNKLNNES